MDPDSSIRELRVCYYRAARCWRHNNIQACLLLCDDLTRSLARLIPKCSAQHSNDLSQLKHLVWLLKIKCLADDYHINECLLLNEDDIDTDDEVRVVSTSRATRAGQTGRATSFELGEHGRTTATMTGRIGSRLRTGAITGRVSGNSSRQSGRATTSYRPLTTSLTATQTAFSRSTRPLLKYSSSKYLSKVIFEYLYSAQLVTNNCPDYRQCLEYLSMTLNRMRKQRTDLMAMKTGQKSIGSTADEQSQLGIFWLTALGTCYFNLRLNKQAEEHFIEAKALDPKHLDSYTWLVKIYLRLNEPALVLKTCADGLKHSKNSMLYNWLARVQSLMGDFYSAHKNLRESLRSHPTNLEALANVGHHAFYGDKMELSLKCFERINQLYSCLSTNIDNDPSMSGNISQLLNNLALCNLYCGFYHRVVPFFFRSLLCSPSKEVTSDIWYNMSFIPLSCGIPNLAIACLRLAVRNNSQNEEAINNLGVLKFGALIDEQLELCNRQELWGHKSQRSSQDALQSSTTNLDDLKECNQIFDQAETYFASVTADLDDASNMNLSGQPEMIHNMAIVKHRRGQPLAAVKYCNLYLQHDPSDFQMKRMLRGIQKLMTITSWR